MKSIVKIVLLIYIIHDVYGDNISAISPVSDNLSNTGREMSADTILRTPLLIAFPFPVDIYEPSSGVRFYNDGIIFLSSNRKEGKMVPQHISFGAPDTYFALLNDSATHNHRVFSPRTTFAVPIDGVTFSSDYQTMFYTKAEKQGKEKIFRADYYKLGNMQGWFYPTQPLTFCTENVRYSHPALSVDGNRMVFASDMTGTEGGMDLFMVEKDGEGWTEPKNLGYSVNTRGNELFPFLDQENNLFFSSDGHPGYGGYDIYVSKFNGQGWDTPLNLSHRINSSDDDVAFSISRANGRDAFLTRKPASPKGEVQLYRVMLPDMASDGGINLTSLLFDLSLPLTALTSPEKEETEGEVAIIAEKAEETKKGSEEQKIVPAAEEKAPVKHDTEAGEVKTTITVSQDTKEEAKKAEIPIKQEKETREEKKTATTKPAATQKTQTPAPVTPKVSEVKKDVVIYRVQITSSDRAKGSVSITIGGENYRTYEYLYQGAYRTTVGEFSVLAEAAAFQNLCRRSGYPQAFVVAFKNGVRSLDRDLFR